MPDELALRRQCLAAMRALAARFPDLTTPAAKARLEIYLIHQCEGEKVPTKDTQTLHDDSDVLAVRVPHTWMLQIDTHVETLRTAAPWAKAGRSDAIRDLLWRGLESLHAPAAPPDPLKPLQRRRRVRSTGNRASSPDHK
jgi:hypothetical protein